MALEYLSQFDLLQIRTRYAAITHERYELLNRDGLLSALAAPQQIVFGQELHPTLWDKAATLLLLLIKNHPFYDGNKRIALLGVREFLRRNGWELGVPEHAAGAFTRSIALGDATAADIVAWLEARSRPLSG